MLSVARHFMLLQVAQAACNGDSESCKAQEGNADVGNFIDFTSEAQAQEGNANVGNSIDFSSESLGLKPAQQKQVKVLLQKHSVLHVAVEHEKETKTIYVVFNSFDDTKNVVTLIMDAMEEAGMALGAWAPLNAHHVPDKNSTFPLSMDIAFERRPSVSAQADTTPAYAQALLPEKAKQDENQALIDLHLEDEGSELRTSSLPQPTQKEISWAARQIAKLQGPVCSRHRESKRSAYGRTPYLKWWWESCAHNYEDILGICYKNCDAGYYPTYLLCQRDCNYGRPGLPTREDTLTECIEKCADVPGKPSPFSETCSLFYCGKSKVDCAAHGIEIAGSFAMAALSTLGSLKSGLKAAQKINQIGLQRSPAQRRLLFKAMTFGMAGVILGSLPELSLSGLKVGMIFGTGHKYGHYDTAMKESIKNLILERGAEEVAGASIAETETGDWKDTAVEVLQELDPTGIVDIVQSFESDRCRDKILEPFPDDRSGAAAQINNKEAIDDYVMQSASGPCKGNSVGGEQKEDIFECAKACTARSDCRYFAYCSKGGDPPCTGAHENKCAMYSTCTAKDTTAGYQGYMTLKKVTSPPCNGDYLKYCDSYPDLKQHYCSGNRCTTDEQRRNCEAHYNSNGKAEIAEGRRSSPLC